MADMCFDNPKVSRLISLGRPKDEIIPYFKDLVTVIVKTNVSYDPRNMGEDDLIQSGLIKAAEIIDKYRPEKGSLFHYSSSLIRHHLWAEAKLRPLERVRSSDEVDFDAEADKSFEDLGETADEAVVKAQQQILLGFKLHNEGLEDAALYVMGVFQSNLFDSNRARVLKTLTHGYDVNLKQARYLADTILIKLRLHSGVSVSEVRDDKLFYNKYKHTVIPELRDLITERAFERLIHFFGGLTITIPSKEQLDCIDRDLNILKAMSHDWTCGPALSKKYGISPEGIKAVFKSCLHKLHTDPEYRELVSKMLDLDRVPGFVNPTTGQTKKRQMPKFGEKRAVSLKKMKNTDGMGFQIGTRNSLLYTLIVNGNSTREGLVTHILNPFGGTKEAARGTVSAFLSDIKQPVGRLNTSRNLRINTGPNGELSFVKENLLAAQQMILEKKRKNMELLDSQPLTDAS